MKNKFCNRYCSNCSLSDNSYCMYDNYEYTFKSKKKVLFILEWIVILIAIQELFKRKTLNEYNQYFSGLRREPSRMYRV